MNPKNCEVLVCHVPITEQDEDKELYKFPDGVHPETPVDNQWLKEKLLEDPEIPFPGDF